MDVTPKELKGKLLLDAGCGNGELSIALSEYGMKVIGIDRSNSVYRAVSWAKTKKSINVSFLRGDVTNPPFIARSFDFVFSSGVIHHTPSTKKSLFSLGKLVKPRGKMFVWIYLKHKFLASNYSKTMMLKIKLYEIIRRFVSRSPAIIQEIFCYFMLFLNVCKNMSTSELKEKLIFFHDTFTPKYAHKHSPEEIIAWFRMAGFKNIKITDTTERGGVGIMGVKA
jgi:ubiquinone/menaquinone biosynthesis C-methylase UbiE